MKWFTAVAAGVMVIVSMGREALGAAVQTPVMGLIERIVVDNPADLWSGGSIKVGGQTLIVPRNLLIDLPANRLTLQQILEQAPPACQALGETGLSWTDACLQGEPGGFATIAANQRRDGLIVAGDIFIQRGIELLSGTITYISYSGGYFRVNGTAGDPNTGTLVRLNDPDSRHTIQQGPGCDPALGPNCSADPRFTLDANNYTNTFTTGYPLCIPSTLLRGGPVASSTGSDLLGIGDALCPDTNRSVNNGVGEMVQEATRFAPIKLGDKITAEGNYETVNGVTFLSSHTTMVNTAMMTPDSPGVPDYFIPAEVFVDVPGFQNERARSLIIGFTTRRPGRVNIWSLHYDPVTNALHEFPFASSEGCDIAAGAGTCTSQGIQPGGWDIFKVLYDVDFILFNAGTGIKPKLSPCAHLRAGGFDVCPNGGTFAEEFAILSPAPHEIIGRSQNRIDAMEALANDDIPMAVTADVNGNETLWGEYLFPFGIGLGGISTPEFVEIDLNNLTSPFIFEGIPWNLDRRLSPAGCDGACEATPQPLCPFPASELDPRTQAGTPTGSYSDPAFTNSSLSAANNRIFSFVDGTLGLFDGNATLLDPLPPAECTAPVVVETAVESIATVDDATFTTDVGAGSSQWAINGTLTGLFASSNTVTIHLGDDLTGPVIGTTQVDSQGAWFFVEPNTATSPGPTQTISVEFTNGSQVLGVPIEVLNI